MSNCEMGRDAQLAKFRLRIDAEFSQLFFDAFMTVSLLSESC